MEENEWAFCSLWTRKKRVKCATALVNERLVGDYFFNRATVEGCDVSIEKVARVFWQEGMDCHLYFRSRPPRGLHRADTMHVLKASENAAPAGRVEVCRQPDIPVWIDVFCRSFSVPWWKDEVARIITKNAGRLELLLAYHGGRPAGCAALYTKNKVTGLYCLGTLPRFRSMGIATSILQGAKALAKSDFLFLQTLASENLLGLYKKAGFTTVYKKSICVVSRGLEDILSRFKTE
jgi:ribosomal protein S18 acetylase RimI-like enzyme